MGHRWPLIGQGAGWNSCRHESDAYWDALEKWSNYSHVWDNNTEYFRSYVCMNVHYEEVKESCESTEAQLVFILGIFGFIGSFLSTATFYRRPFIPSDVYLYRMVGIVETIHMFVMTLIHGLNTYIDCTSSFACMLFSAHAYMTLTNGCADAVEFVVVFLCIERTVACLAPQHFHRIHRLATYRIVALVSILSSLPFNIVHSFDVNVVPDQSSQDVYQHERASDENVLVDESYREIPSWFSYTWLYARVMDAQMIRFCLVAPLIIISTVGSIIGLNQAARRKRRLRGDIRNETVMTRKTDGKNRKGSDIHSKAAARSRKEIKQMIELCCLQLCLAIPIVINYLLCLVERICKTGVIERSKLWEEAFRTMTYEQARTTIKRATMLEYLRFSISVTHMLAHGLHFYLYLLFSAKFRRTFGIWLKGQRSYCIFARWSRDREPFVSGDGLTTGYDRVKTGPAYSNYELTQNKIACGGNDR